MPIPAPPAALLDYVRSVEDSPTLHGYTFYDQPEFEAATLQYLSTLAPGVRAEELDVVATDGAKGALALLARGLVEPGDHVLVTDPGYEAFATQAEQAGAFVQRIPFAEGADLLAQLESLTPEALDQVHLLLVNFPNNPTGSLLNRSQWQRLVTLCSRHQILLINDAAYAPFVFNEADRTSPFDIEGAHEIALEVHTFSKAFQIPGWRLGFVVGAHTVVKRLRQLASVYGSGSPRLLQGAVLTALRDMDYAQRLRAETEARLQGLVAVLRKHGFAAELPKATFFCFLPRTSALDQQRAGATGCISRCADAGQASWRYRDPLAGAQ